MEGDASRLAALAPWDIRTELGKAKQKDDRERNTKESLRIYVLIMRGSNAFLFLSFFHEIVCDRATSTILTSSLNSTQQIFDGYRSAQSNMLTSKPGHGSGSGQQQHGSIGRSYQQSQPPQQQLYAPVRTSQGSSPNLVFKSSPFYKAIQTLSPPRLCLGKDSTLHSSMAFLERPLSSHHDKPADPLLSRPMSLLDLHCRGQGSNIINNNSIFNPTPTLDTAHEV